MAARVALGSLAALSLSLQGCGNGGNGGNGDTPAPVVVELYGESGCPDTRAFVLGPLKTAISTPLTSWTSAMFPSARRTTTPQAHCAAQGTIPATLRVASG